MGLVSDRFGANVSFGGFSIHEYGKAYLGDLPDMDENGRQKWPAINDPIWQPGDVFVGVLNGNYRIYDNIGNSKGTVSTGYQGLNGMPVFDNDFNLYVAAADQGTVIKFNGEVPHNLFQVIDTSIDSPGRPYFINLALNGDFFVDPHCHLFQ